ncbi:MAG: SDR family NAD(P)-dependent oxidoreductase [Solirubrobacterales bacterium]|nr:SDR family NAD(P)-dependent oxidoreductase [Solirubrobacterales bacterium]
MEFKGMVALVTGGANGIGRAVGGRLRALGAEVILADIEDETGASAAAEIGAGFVRCDVSRPEDSATAVELAVERFGGLDLAFLNAGISTGTFPGSDFDLAAYRRAMGVNLDGVVFGLNAVLPALRERGGGAVVATSSLAGLTAVPFDPIYAANKHAVVGLVRSLGPALVGEGIRVNAICPGFADTRIVDPLRDGLADGGVPLIPVDRVVDGVIALFNGDDSGTCHFVQPGREPQEFHFRSIPGPRSTERA